MDNLIFLLEIVFLWYISGLILTLCGIAIDNIRGQEIEIRVDDIIYNLKNAAFGPLLLFMVLIYIAEKVDDFLKNKRDKVLWRNKRAKTKHILFGKKDDTK